ncbi:putative immunity protein [Kribbella sp. NPDC049174]|uniref:putative immunity protein n=1 Tax=Kribbella sp. NPDC049174 TaxID=3364112 RepID=UPI003720CCF3
MKLTDEGRCAVTQFAVDCAERALPLFEAKAPTDTRPREAIEAARAYALGGQRTAQLRSCAWAAQKAAGEVGDPAAKAAARAAVGAAGAPYIHDLESPHQLNHVLGPAVSMAQARELATDDPALGDEEIRWAIEHASPLVRKVVRRWPARDPGRTRLSTLNHQLDKGLRD